MKKASPLTKRASARSRTIFAKAAAISRLVLALRTWICSPMARAAASKSLTAASWLGPLIDLILGRVEFDRHVLALDIASVLQALAESAQLLLQPLMRLAAEEPDHWHPRLLRARRERPCCGCTEHRDELASFHSMTSIP